jgi:hypothetical protein
MNETNTKEKVMIAKLYNSEINFNEVVDLINSTLPIATSKVATYKIISKSFILSLAEFCSAWDQSNESARADSFIRTHGPGWIWPKWVKPYL